MKTQKDRLTLTQEYGDLRVTIDLYGDQEYKQLKNDPPFPPALKKALEKGEFTFYNIELTSFHGEDKALHYFTGQIFSSDLKEREKELKDWPIDEEILPRLLEYWQIRNSLQKEPSWFKS